LAIFARCASNQDGKHDQPRSSGASQPWNSKPITASLRPFPQPTLILRISWEFPFMPDPEKTYDLVALIDLAQEANPQTRIAWEHARAQAAQLESPTVTGIRRMASWLRAVIRAMNIPRPARSFTYGPASHPN